MERDTAAGMRWGRIARQRMPGPRPGRASLAAERRRSHVLLLCQERLFGGEVVFGRGGRGQESPNAAGEVALEAANGVALGLAFGLLAGDVVLRLDVAAGARDGHAM